MMRRVCYGLLIALTLLTFEPVRSFDFITFDDPAYVSNNPFIEHGLTWKGIRWAFTAGLTFDSPNSDHWQPVTWLCRMIEVEFFGLNPRAHHVVNLFFHLANTLLLYEALRRMTRDDVRSAFVAALFAIHPLHVEAVAWITALKDVLSGFFWMLTLLSYVRYTALRSPPRYMAVIAFTLLTMMSKPIGMTLPLVLILMDFWPLQRAPFIARDGLPLRAWLMEKIPLLVLAAFSAAIALRAQSDHLKTSLNPAAMAFSLATYVIKSIVPTQLCVWHPAIDQVSLLPAVAAAALLILISGVAIREHSRHPHLLVGWGWFLVTLLPVLSLKEISWAERFTYLPLIGLGIMVAWSLPAWNVICGARRAALGVSMAAVALIFAAASHHQVGFWRDSVSLYERALKVTRDNFWIHNSLGVVLSQQKDYTGAEKHFREAIAIQPAQVQSYWNYGNMLMDEQRVDDAIQEYQQAVSLAPNNADMATSLGSAYSAKNQIAKAIEQYRKALKINPMSIKAACELGVIFVQLGKIEDGIQFYRTALRVEPDNAALCNNMGNALLKQSKFDEAASYYRQALTSAPDLLSVRDNLGTALLFGEKIEEAIQTFKAVIQLNPGDARAHYNLAICYLRMGQLEEARLELQKTVLLTPSPFAEQAREDLLQWQKP